MAKDKCVVCGDITPYDFDTNIEMRHYYIEGAGQLCEDCYLNTKEHTFEIPKYVFSKYPNDAELGQKIRELYYKSK